MIARELDIGDVAGPRAAGPRKAGPRMAGSRGRLPFSPWHLVLIPATIILLFPFVWLVVTSIETPAEALHFPPDLTPNVIRLQNYPDALAAAPFGRFFLNSIVVAVSTVLANLVLCAAAGYAFARFRFLGRTVLFVVIMMTLMVPFQVTMIPQFLITKWIGVHLLAGAGIGHIGASTAKTTAATTATSSTATEAAPSSASAKLSVRDVSAILGAERITGGTTGSVKSASPESARTTQADVVARLRLHSLAQASVDEKRLIGARGVGRIGTWSKIAVDLVIAVLEKIQVLESLICRLRTGRGVRRLAAAAEASTTGATKSTTSRSVSGTRLLRCGSRVRSILATAESLPASGCLCRGGSGGCVRIGRKDSVRLQAQFESKSRSGGGRLARRGVETEHGHREPAGC